MEQLEKLKEKRAKLQAMLDERETYLSERLTEFFRSLQRKEDLEMLPLKVSISKPCWGKHKETSPYEISIEVQFKAFEKDRIAKGFKTDFASSFSLYIYQDGIEMNIGTCGQHGHEDLGQVARAILVGELWKREGYIINIVDSSVAMSTYERFKEVDLEIYRIEEDIKKAEQEREKQEILQQIKKAKFICKRRTAEDGDWDENNHWILKRKYYVYHSFEKIKKVTDKSVLTVDEWFHDNHRHDLNSIIWDVRCGSLFLQNEKISTEDAPLE